MDSFRLPSGSSSSLLCSLFLDEEMQKLLDQLDDVSDYIGYAAFHVLEFRKKIMQNISQEEVEFLVMKFLGKKMISVQCQAKLGVLTRKLNIKQKTYGNNHVVTLFRIAQAFPDVVAVNLEKNPNIDGPLTLAQMRLHSEYPEFPALAIQPLLACLLPRAHAESTNILNVFFFSNMMLSEMFNKKSELWGSKTKLQRAAEIRRYQMNHYHSKVLEEDVRKEWCNKLKIMVDNEYTTVWIEAATKSKAKLVEIYGMSVDS